MLPYILALVIGLGSFAFYMAAFFLPEIHRKNDFIWSGIGLFYALILWACGERITGAVLLGQMASVSLLGWLGWQTLTMRLELTSPDKRTKISPEILEKIKNLSIGGFGQQLLQPITNLLGKKPAKTPPCTNCGDCYCHANCRRSVKLGRGSDSRARIGESSRSRNYLSFGG
ncbi:MAG TPA: hypothetical protein DEA78_11605 [Cyanobacteria bacterium UBA11159]|nr:hypothetical protein [Cyanobacteria bacterium UBA11159]